MYQSLHVGKETTSLAGTEAFGANASPVIVVTSPVLKETHALEKNETNTPIIVTISFVIQLENYISNNNNNNKLLIVLNPKRVQKTAYV